MNFQPKKNILLYSIFAVMVLVLLATVSKIVSAQVERNAFNKEANRISKNIDRLVKNEIPRLREQRESLCNATTLRTKMVRGNLSDIGGEQVVRVRVARVPYGRSSIQDSRTEAIEFVSVEPRLPLSPLKSGS